MSVKIKQGPDFEIASCYVKGVGIAQQDFNRIKHSIIWAIIYKSLEFGV